MTNILIVQERGRHKENVDFRESECLARALRRMSGCDAEVWGLNQSNFDASNPQGSYESALERNDCVFVLENYDEQGWLPDFSKTKKPKAFWSIDSHCALGKHVWFAKQSKFNIHFNSTPEYLKQFAPHSDKTIWLPNAYPADLFRDFAITLESQPVGFCGSMIADRAQWLDSVDKLIAPLKVKRDIFVIGNKMVNALHSYEISLNRSISIDVNYRVFESMASRALLITNSDPPALSQIFVPGKHLLTYTSTQDLADKIRWTQQNKDQANIIAMAGHQEVAAKHSYDHRAKTILESFKSL